MNIHVKMQNLASLVTGEKDAAESLFGGVPRDGLVSVVSFTDRSSHDHPQGRVDSRKPLVSGSPSVIAHVMVTQTFWQPQPHRRKPIPKREFLMPICTEKFVWFCE